ncbi:MAG: hypothetical protein HKN79_08430 [Flavobacteriales bacterium]|nr:hypothetical protein [Flavobacteriales bacterium]
MNLVKNLSFSLILLLFTGLVSAQDYLISDGGTITTCAGSIYDSGGPDGDYSNFDSDTLTICSDDPDACLGLAFVLWEVEGGDYDEMFIYDGADTTGTLLGVYDGSVNPGFIEASGTCITLVFVSDFSVTFAGFQIDITCACPSCEDGVQNGEELGIDCGGPDCEECEFVVMNGDLEISSCDETVLDNGINEEYSNNSNDILTICSVSPGDCVKLDFISFDLEQGYDFVRIYAGADINAPLYGEYTGSFSPGIVEIGTECVTVQFTSDGSVTDPGYEFTVSCDCPTCDDGILNGQELATDCGGPDCPACTFSTIDEGGTVNGCEMTLFDSGLEGNYSENEDLSMSFCSEDGLDSLFVEFQTIQVGIGDHLYIYEGEGTSGELIADITAAVAWPDFFTSSACVTYRFVSNETGNSQGFEIDMTCAGDILSSLGEESMDGFNMFIMARGHLHLSHPVHKNFTVEIMDLSGKLVLSRTISDHGYIDTSDLSEQFYILLIGTNEGRRYSQRLFLSK